MPLIVPPISLAPGSFSTGIDSPVTIDSSTALLPSSTTPSTGTLSPGRTRRRSPTCTCSSGTSSSSPSSRDAARRLRREIEQRADGAAGLLARAQLQHLPEQHQHGDHGGGLEVDRRPRRPCRRARRKQAGRERRDEAVEIGGADAERDQAEHVEDAVDDRRPAAHEERPARPQHDRRREHELNPDRDLRRNVVVQVERGKMRAHFQDRRPAPRARRRSRTGASCRSVRGSAPPRR